MTAHRSPLAVAAKQLTPTQTAAYVRLEAALSGSPLTLLLGEVGVGKSTIVDRLLATRDGRKLTPRDIYEAARYERNTGFDIRLDLVERGGELA